MSRIGKRILTIPEGVELKMDENLVTVKGPKGELSTKINALVTVEVEGNTVKTTIKKDSAKAIYGTMNTLIYNMIVGVTEGYTKKLTSHGVGYRFAVVGNIIDITAGFSHKVERIVPAGLVVESPKNTELVISGIDKQLVGEFAAKIREIRAPEPYKGKGIRYDDEIVRRKEGKKAA